MRQTQSACTLLEQCLSPRMQMVVNEIKQVARHDSSVVLQGGSGTGKEVAAQAIHQLSFRQPKSFVAVDCTSLPSELIENELFGHEKGAYTSAHEQHLGRVELAHGGTLFLDEIGELPLKLQPKLLRTLETRSFTRVGGTRTIQSDFRLIVATNRDLWRMVEERQFREDLYYRLNIFPITVPPLRERKEDIVPLATHFLESAGFYGVALTDEIKEMLQAYSWPGNVRELRNMMERAAIKMNGTGTFLPEHLSLPASSPRQSISESANIEELLEALVEKAEATELSFDKLTELVQRTLLVRRLRQHGGELAPAARSLGKNRHTLAHLMKKLGIMKSFSVH